MGKGIEGRLKRLEERAEEEGRSSSEEQEKEHWLAQARIRRREVLKERDADHARSLIELFRIQYLISEMGADELVNQILSWRPAPDGGRSRPTVEREVGLEIHNREPGMEGMTCPSAWRESFAAGDELRERYDAVPDEDLAEHYVCRALIEERGNEEELKEWAAHYEEWFGITEELMNKAIGPDIGEITEEERQRRINGYLADCTFGEKGYRIARHMERIEDLEVSRGEGRS